MPTTDRTSVESRLTASWDFESASHATITEPVVRCSHLLGGYHRLIVLSRARLLVMLETKGWPNAAGVAYRYTLSPAAARPLALFFSLNSAREPMAAHDEYADAGTAPRADRRPGEPHMRPVRTPSDFALRKKHTAVFASRPG